MARAHSCLRACIPVGAVFTRLSESLLSVVAAVRERALSPRYSMLQCRYVPCVEGAKEASMSKRKLLTALVAVSTLVLTSAITPASARWHGRWHGGGWRGAGVAAAIGAGLALGAAAAYRGGYGYGYPSYYGYGYPFSYYGYGYGYGRGRSGCFTNAAYC